MSLNIEAQKINFGPIRPTVGVMFWLIIGVVLTGIVLYASALVLFQGQMHFASSDQVPWNIFVSAYVFFVVTSTGLCFISAFGHVFGIEKYELIGKRAVFASLVFLAVGMYAIVIEIGRPWMMLHYVTSPNIASPMFWMGVFYGLYGLFLLLELVFIIMGKLRATQISGIFGFIVAVIAHGMLGALFGMTYARDMWFGPYMPIYFIMSAFVSGLGSLCIIILLSYKSKNQKMPERMSKLINDMGLVFGYALGALLFFVFWKTAAGLYAGKTEAYMLVMGDFAMRFWVLEVMVGIIIPMAILLYRATRTHLGIFIAAIMVLTGLVTARLNLVVVGQLKQPLGQPLATYSPNTLEIMFFIGLFGAFALVYIIGSYLFRFEDYEAQVAKALDEHESH
ncbi:NrfD/PsrC family molybdoenzyme membrane anchor subunit [Desulfurispira natronophila]|uniref:Molybdopterin-containing oxidoreductase family membrane subunit n=1 Tax=Desulfurispira natronophila TaxID=682562 RepID=A0A7W7Y3F5_9BACT|nr:NrfD/PsrC family molybdoenzyme membrane anchor subunit [Desulfurispira natronophila]MBB5021308.1 molybdopterin-containing oxidoreductase family membrane subunit [Desulfurispira natronophila]